MSASRVHRAERTERLDACVAMWLALTCVGHDDEPTVAVGTHVLEVDKVGKLRCTEHRETIKWGRFIVQMSNGQRRGSEET